MKDFRILFYIRRDKENRKKQVPIYARLTIDGVKAELSIRRFIDATKWRPGHETVTGSSNESKEINKHIETVRTKLNNLQDQLERTGNPYTAADLRNAYFGIMPVKRSLIALFLDHNKDVKAQIGNGFAKGTLARYETTLKHLRNFLLAYYDLADYALEDIDHEFITKFEVYLKTDHTSNGNKINKCANNSAVKYIKNFKKIVRLALSNGWIVKDPFINYKAKLKPVDRGYLTQEEIEVIAAKTFVSPRLTQVRDAFLFQCFTGAAYSDLKKLTPANVVTTPDGKQHLDARRTKTNNRIYVPLLEPALVILNNYTEHPECVIKGKLLPVLSNQKMNSYLKEIGDVCGITRIELSSHLARHTFATTVTLAKGVSLEVVSKMLAHSNTNTTRIYARMMDTRVAEEMETLNQKMKKPVIELVEPAATL